MGSEDVETLDLNWGDGSATDVGSNNCGLSCVLQKIQFLTAFPCAVNHNSNFTCLPFSDSHQYAKPGVYTVSVALTDQAGATQESELTEAVLYPTQTAVGSSADPSVGGQPVTFSASVTGGDGGGTVAFTDGSTTISNCAAVQLTGTSSPYRATCTSSSVAAGDAITAAYGGDASSAASSSTVTQLLFLPVTVTGSETYGGTSTFTPSETLPSGVTIGGSVSCSTVNSGTAISTTLQANGYTIDGVNCSGLFLSGSASPNYVVSYTGATFTVNKATPLITWANPSSIVYGTALGATELDATPNVAGSFTYSPPATTLVGGGLGQTLSTIFTPSDGTDYTQATATTQIDITRAAQSVSFPVGSPTIATVGEKFTPAASASSALPVVITAGSSSAAVCSLNKSTGQLTFTAVGTCLLDAAQAGNNNYLAASKTLSIAVYLPGSLTYNGALTYKDSGPMTTNNVTIRPSTGAVTAVSGTIGLPGVRGGNATITVAVFSVRNQLHGVVVVRDAADHFDATSTITGALTRTSTGEVKGTASGQAGGHAYTLAFTI